MKYGNVGFMRERVIVQEQTNITDLDGSTIITWADVATLWGRVTPYKDTNPLIGGRSQGQNMFHILVRAIYPITTLHRIVWRDRKMLIQGVENIDETRRYYELHCFETEAP